MRKNYDFSKARRGPTGQQPGKTGISIQLDDDLLKTLRERGDAAGRGYQAMIDQALREYLGRWPEPVGATDDPADPSGGTAGARRPANETGS
jgi:hypothetical protein